ncbi:unnamed protein product [Oikopleura dioica]|uniref:Peptidase S1 domain-containing protein n=1 Tax=Oikopleura dioica TaxID=34765 RepID=E4YPI4_OIKDI|nr:unnamed protein product [Oikopleura dioica]
MRGKLLGVLLSISGLVSAEDPARSFFDWDDKTVDGFFCENSRYAFYNGLDKNGDTNLLKPIPLPTISKEEANSVLQTGKKFSILNFGGFFETSLERVAIEEYCQDGKLKEHEYKTCRETKQKFVGSFCKDSDSEFYANEYGSLKQFEEKLNKVRQEKYDRCTKHVKERMTQVMGKISKKSTSGDEKKWQSELKPDRLFRGWWHELSKAFLRVCMTDITDCARRCNYENGVCQLAKDPTADKKWVYECQCQPDYEPVVSSNTDPMILSELCSRTKVDAPKGSCSPLRHAKRFDMERSETPTMTEKGDTLAVDYEFLCQYLSPNKVPWNCDHSIDRINRERRAIGSNFSFERNEYISQTDFGFFPWVVELNYYPSKNFKNSSAKIVQKDKDRDKAKGTETHMCSGTLISGREQDFIITAGHCFCTDREIGQWLVRIGIIDNTKHLNLFTGNLDKLTEEDLGSEKYIDVTIEKWRIGARNKYLEDGCPPGYTPSGYDDVAILYLNGKMSEEIRKSLQHNVRHSCISGFENFNELKDVDPKNLNEFYGSRCFLAGWGDANSENEVTTLGIPQKSNFINVRVVPFEECKNDPIYGLRNDASTVDHLDADNPLFICAKGFEGSSSCGGDSGGGLFCFSEDGQSVHLLGPLHGTTAGDCTDANAFMYFANLAHKRYSNVIDKIQKKQTAKDEL